METIDKKNLPLVSVVMLAWNRKKDVEEGLTHVFESTYTNIEVIVVDNASTDGTPEMIEDKFTEVRLIRMLRNIGIEGYNVGFANAKGKYIVVLDDDSFPQKDAIKKMVEEFRKDKNIGVIAFKIIVPSTKEVITKGWPRKVASFWGCGAGLRKDVIKRVGYYDVSLFLYGNERDLAIRIWNGGYKVVYNDRIITYHKLSPSLYRITNKGMFLETRNQMWFNYKYLGGKYLVIGIIRAMFVGFGRAIKRRVLKGYLVGILTGIGELKKVKSKRVTVEKKIVKFYFENCGFYEPVFKRIKRLLKGSSYEECYYSR